MAVDYMKGKPIAVQVLIDSWHSNRTAQSIADELGITFKSLRYRWETLKQKGKLPRDRKPRPVDFKPHKGMNFSNRTSVVGEPEPEDAFDGRPRVKEEINELFLKLLAREQQNAPK